MKKQHVLSISEARKRIFEIAEEVQKPGAYYMLTENGRAKVVMISAQEFESLQETLEIISDPQIMKNIQQAEKAFSQDEYYTWDELKEELGFSEQNQWLVADKRMIQYGSEIKKRKKQSR